MRHVNAVMTVALLLGCAHTGSAQQAKPKASNYPPQIGGSTVEVYKTVGDVKLNMYIFTPEGHQATDKRPAIVFFFGGGWRGGSPTQFAGQCQYLASRGMVAMTADYRVLSRHGTPAAKCVADAKSAIRWVRTNAARLGVDPDRIVASGGSAGGHIAACTGVIKGFDEESEDTSTSSVPNAMVLFNPATVLAPVEGEPPIDADRMASLKERMGVEPIELSPYHHVSAGAPPTLILHGKADTTVPYHTVELFTEAMTKAGNRCELEGYADQAHGFFNARGAHNAMYTATLRRADVFLKSLGYLEGEPTLAAE